MITKSRKKSSRFLKVFWLLLLLGFWGCAPTPPPPNTVTLNFPSFPDAAPIRSDVIVSLKIGEITCPLTLTDKDKPKGSCANIPLGTHPYTVEYIHKSGVIIAMATGTMTVQPGNNAIIIPPLNTTIDDDNDKISNMEEVLKGSDPKDPNSRPSVNRYPLTITTDGTGSGTTSGAGTYEYGSIATVSATPNAGSIFAGWSEEGCSGTGACMVSMTQARNVTATFTLTVASRTLLSIAIAPANPSILLGATQQFSARGTFTGGITMDLTNSVTWSSSDTSVATINTSGLATGVASGTTAITVTAMFEAISGTTTLTVTPTPTVTPIVDSILTVTLSGAGSGTVTSLPAGINCGLDCSDVYPQGTLVTLTATSVSGAVFGGFSGDVDCTDGSVRMDASKTCIATFTPTLTLTVTKAGTGSGTVTSLPAGINCGNTCSAVFAQGTSVTLTATPDAGSSFAGWGGTDGVECVTGLVLMTANKSCTGTFNTVITGGTPLSGAFFLNKTLTLSESPYRVVGNVQIPRGITLTIEPGVTVAYDGAYEILIKGNIIANGTSTQKITFTSSTGNSSLGATQIRFVDTDLSQSQISYVKMEWGSISIYTSSGNTMTLSISNAQFDNTAVTATVGNIIISNSTLNKSKAHVSNYNLPCADTLTIQDSTLTDSTASLDYGSCSNLIVQGINGSGNTVSGAPNVRQGTVKLLDSTLTDSTVSCGVSATCEIARSQLTNSTISGYAHQPLTITDTTLTFTGTTGINCYDSFYPKNCTISYSKITGQGSGTGINMSSGSVSNTEIRDTSVAIKIGSGVPTISNNNFINCCSTYAVENKSGSNITATNNYWGTMDENVVKQKIFDYYDDLNYGAVTYSPFLISPAPPHFP